MSEFNNVCPYCGFPGRTWLLYGIVECWECKKWYAFSKKDQEVYFK